MKALRVNVDSSIEVIDCDRDHIADVLGCNAVDDLHVGSSFLHIWFDDDGLLNGKRPNNLVWDYLYITTGIDRPVIGDAVITYANHEGPGDVSPNLAAALIAIWELEGGRAVLAQSAIDYLPEAVA